MLHKSKQLFAVWNEKVSYCHWKGNDHLQEGLDGDTDLDVLLSKEDKEEGIAVLKEIGFRKFRSQFGSRYPDVEDWIGFDEATGRLIHLHLHFSLMTGHTGLKEYRLPWTEESLELRQQDAETGVYIMNPNLELISLYTRLVLKARHRYIAAARLDKYRVNKHFTREIDYIKQRVDWNDVSHIASKYYGKDAPEFVALAQGEGLSSREFLRLRAIVGRAMKPCCRYHGIGLVVRRWYYLMAVPFRIKQRNRYGRMNIIRKVANPQRGLTIAFLGQDGAGKSTVTKDIKKWLTWKIDAEQFYLGSGEHFMPWERKLQQRLHGSSNIVAKALRAWLPFSLLTKLARRVRRDITKANIYAAKGGIALFDRYPQTAYPGINDGPKIRSTLLPMVPKPLQGVAKWFVGKEERNLAKAVETEPDVVFKLMLSPEESMRRKPFEDEAGVRRKHDIIKSLRFEKSQVYDIDATQEYQAELTEIKNIIWQHILGL